MTDWYDSNRNPRSNHSYDVAQICLNGHVINDSSRQLPQHNQNFCKECGQATITTCPSCSEPIKGYYYVSGNISISHYEVPKFCDNCGKPYPWTQGYMEAAKELADTLDNLTDEEKADLKKDLDDIFKAAPRAEVAGLKFKKAMLKAGKETADMFRVVLISVVSEAAKKQLGI